MKCSKGHVTLFCAKSQKESVQKVELVKFRLVDCYFAQAILSIIILIAIGRKQMMYWKNQENTTYFRSIQKKYAKFYTSDKNSNATKLLQLQKWPKLWWNLEVLAKTLYSESQI